jgi:F-type H+-transporting ATPase subunit alpha
MDTALFNRNLRPAVDVGQSVSRVGGAAQVKAMREAAGRLKLDLAQYQEVARFARFGTEVDETTQRQIQRGLRLETALSQPEHQPLPLGEQIVVLLAVTGGHMDDVALADIPEFERRLLGFARAKHSELLAEIKLSGALSAETRVALDEALAAFRTVWAQDQAA